MGPMMSCLDPTTTSVPSPPSPLPFPKAPDFTPLSIARLGQSGPNIM